MVTEFNTADSIQSEINEVLSNVLAEINENQRIIELGQPNPFQQNQPQHQQSHKHEDHQPHHFKPIHHIDMVSGDNSPDHLDMKPLTPESLLAADDSLINSPNGLNQLADCNFDQNEMLAGYDHANMTKNEAVNENHASELMKQVEFLNHELEKFKRLYDSKSINLTKSMKELKKSEILRLKLMEENRDLKKVVRKLTLTEAVSSSNHAE